MIGWEKKITDTFINHYFASISEAGEGRRTLRVRSSLLFPAFDTVHPDEKESYLEAAESLERKGVVKLRWEKQDKGERLKTLSCENFEKLFAEAGRPHPETESEKIKALLEGKVTTLKKSLDALNGETSPPGIAEKKVLAVLEFLFLRFGPREIGQRIDQQTMEELIRLLEFSLEPAHSEMITIRALSILLYRDSKRLENLLALCNPLLTRVQKAVPLPSLFFLERSYPEIMISGKIIIEFKNAEGNVGPYEPRRGFAKSSMINADGHILGLPLESAEAIRLIQPVSAKKEKTVLTIENKETFYALGSPQKHTANESLSRCDCFLYTGGYPNRAAAALIKTFAASGFSFYHAGDLDPDGVLILQHIQDIAGKPVTPVRMDAFTFDHYRAWARPLTRPMLRQIKKIREETKTIPGLADLLRRIEETGLGVEQEIVDYR